MDSALRRIFYGHAPVLIFYRRRSRMNTAIVEFSDQCIRHTIAGVILELPIPAADKIQNDFNVFSSTNASPWY